VKEAPYINFWDEKMTSYYRADVKDNDDKTVTPIPQLNNMLLAVNGALAEPWLDYIQGVNKPAILINGGGIYNLDAPLLSDENARETVAMMKNCRCLNIPGNHQTMLYGDGAKEIVNAIKTFLQKE